MLFKKNDQELRRMMLEDAMRLKALVMGGDYEESETHTTS